MQCRALISEKDRIEVPRCSAERAGCRPPWRYRCRSRRHLQRSGTSSPTGRRSSTPYCKLYATRTGNTVVLRAPQSCTVPTGTALNLDQEDPIGSGTFGNRVDLNAPYCYTIWLSSSTSG